MFTLLGALIIGLTLGLLGSGGSILTVPMLVYLLGHDDKAAIAESLAIVGSIALVASIPYARARLVDWRSVLFFGVPGMAGTYFGAWFSKFIPGPVQLTLFALVMLAAAWMMFRRSRSAASSNGENSTGGQADEHAPRGRLWTVSLEGIAVGVLTGVVGVGGGFLIVPALAVLIRLPMRLAVGTSLAIVAMNAFSGFLKYLDVLPSAGSAIDWPTVGLFILIGVAGSFAGNLLGSRMNQRVLRRVFALFLIGMGLFVLWQEVPGVVAQYRSAKEQPRLSAFDEGAPNSSQIPITLSATSQRRDANEEP